MPKYQLKCVEGHREEVRMTYGEYDQFKGGRVVFYCDHPVDSVTRCLHKMGLALTAIPFVFAINDGDFKVSKKKFGMGNLTEI